MSAPRRRHDDPTSTPPPRLPTGNNRPTYDRVFFGLAVFIATIWGIATVIQLIFPSRVVPPTINYLMIAVAGAFFGGHLVTRRND